MKPRILLLLHLPPPVHGSTIMGQYIQSSKFLKDKFDAKFINLIGSKTIEETGKIKANKIFRFFQTYQKVFWNLTIFKPQVCYFALSTTGTAFIKDLILISLIKLFRVKLVYHLHNKGVSAKSDNKFFKNLYRFVFKNAEVILLSEKLYFDIEAFVPIENIHVCFNGISDTFDFNEKKVSKKPPVILFLSNLLKAKGLFDLVHSLEILKLKGISFECKIIGGEGDVSESILQDKINKLNLTNSVTYLGKKYGLDKRNEYFNSDIFVLPTHEECFPLVLLEAMSFSLPIISTLEGGIEDIVEDGWNGYLIEKNHPKLLSEKIEILLNDVILRSRMGINSRIAFEKKFTLEAFENRLYKILIKISK